MRLGITAALTLMAAPILSLRSQVLTSRRLLINATQLDHELRWSQQPIQCFRESCSRCFGSDPEHDALRWR